MGEAIAYPGISAQISIIVYVKSDNESYLTEVQEGDIINSNRNVSVLKMFPEFIVIRTKNIHH